MPPDFPSRLPGLGDIVGNPGPQPKPVGGMIRGWTRGREACRRGRRGGGWGISGPRSLLPGYGRCWPRRASPPAASRPRSGRSGGGGGWRGWGSRPGGGRGGGGGWGGGGARGGGGGGPGWGAQERGRGGRRGPGGPPAAVAT